jgi:mRNA interferase MazF
MERFISGDVVILPFPFTDLERSKSRPAIVLGSSVEGSYILCQITTQFQQGPHAIALDPDDFVLGRISKSSFVRVDMIFTVIPARIKRKAGHVNPSYVSKVIKQLFDFLELQRL